MEIIPIIIDPQVVPPNSDLKGFCWERVFSCQKRDLIVSSLFIIKVRVFTLVDLNLMLIGCPSSAHYETSIKQEWVFSSKVRNAREELMSFSFIKRLWHPRGGGVRLCIKCIKNQFKTLFELSFTRINYKEISFNWGLATKQKK